MNWDIAFGQGRQSWGRWLQRVGARLQRRALVLRGEHIEYAGRLQSRYGALKHQAQWSAASLGFPREASLSTRVVGARSAGQRDLPSF